MRARAGLTFATFITLLLVVAGSADATLLRRPLLPLLPRNRQAETCSISLYCPPMRIVRTDKKHRRADAEPMVGTFRFSDGTQVEVKDVTIPETVVDKVGLGHWRVRACSGVTQPGNFPQVVVNLPPEEVFVRFDHVDDKFAAFAQPIDCPTTLMLADGRVYTGTTHFGECEADITSVTTAVARPITATGTLARVR